MGATGDYDSTGAPSSAPINGPEANTAEADSDSTGSESPDSDSPGGHSPRPDQQDAA